MPSIGLITFFSPFRAFDVDMLYLAQRFKIPIGEVAISWQEIEGMILLSENVKRARLVRIELQKQGFYLFQFYVV